MTKQTRKKDDSSGQAGAFGEAVRLRARPDLVALMPFLTASETGHAEFDDAPYPEQRAAYVLALLEAVRQTPSD